MAWFKVDDRLHGHVKTRRAGIQAMGLWVVVGSYCADNLTDGVVAADVPALFAGRSGATLAALLVTAGLWHERAEGGWVYHDWAEYQPTAASVRAEREAAKARMNAARSARVRANTQRTPDERALNDGRSSPNPVPVPVPVPKEEELSGAPQAAPQTTLLLEPTKPKPRKARAPKADAPPLPWTIGTMLTVLYDHGGGRFIVDPFDSGLAKPLTAVIRSLDAAGVTLDDVAVGARWVRDGGAKWMSDGISLPWLCKPGNLADVIGKALASRGTT